MASVAVAWLALSAPALAQPALGELVMPVRPACVSSPFGARRAPGPHATGFHNGIDLPAAAGAPVFAAASGVITTIHKRGPGGLELAISHRGASGPYTTLYAHLGTIAPAFADGKTSVKAGERIAVVGRSGVIYGTHLYFEVLVEGRPVDPSGLLGVVPCR
jgi:murein DD-endopeptidase MepM/ murein hydrolase activator NlpD